MALITLRPVLELYCKTGFPEYKANFIKRMAADPHRGWTTCDTLMIPENNVKLFSLQQAISRGTYDPVMSEEWVGCSCKRGEFMFAYRASKREVDGVALLSMEIKCS